MPTATKERPLPLSDWEVRAVQDGRKTQLRRIVKASKPPSISKSGYIKFLEGHPLTRKTGDGFYWCDDTAVHGAVAGPIECPFGKVGGLLWVRESFLPCRGIGDVCKIQEADYVCLRDGCQKYRGGQIVGWGSGSPPKWKGYVFRPSIHMPRWASRLTLEIADIRVERLQEISEEDANAEGVEVDIWDQAVVARNYLTKGEWFQEWSEDLPHYVDLDRLSRESYRSLWESINGPGSWSANPFVWRIAFRRVK